MPRWLPSTSATQVVTATSPRGGECSLTSYPVRSSELLTKLELEDLDIILRERRLRCFGHVERSKGAIRTACDIQNDGSSDLFTILGLWVLGLAVSNINESPLQTNESKTLFLMTSLPYYCIPGLTGTR